MVCDGAMLPRVLAASREKGSRIKRVFCTDDESVAHAPPAAALATTTDTKESGQVRAPAQKPIELAAFAQLLQQPASSPPPLQLRSREGDSNVNAGAHAAEAEAATNLNLHLNALAPVAGKSHLAFRQDAQDRLFTVIFSSGSTGLPKGVMVRDQAWLLDMVRARRTCRTGRVGRGRAGRGGEGRGGAERGGAEWGGGEWGGRCHELL